MNLLVIENHEGEGIFPLFLQGTAVTDICATQESDHWLSCEINGHKTYIPDIYVDNGRLVKDYNPTELVVKRGDRLLLIAVVFEWFNVQGADGLFGWLPAGKVVSV